MAIVVCINTFERRDPKHWALWCIDAAQTIKLCVEYPFVVAAAIKGRGSWCYRRRRSLTEVFDGREIGSVFWDATVV